MPNKSSVVILGMPGSGKTVFLSVLGMKFTTTALGAAKAPLGFRLVPAEKTTYFVENGQAKLTSGKWPASTLVEQENGLAWDVLTGRKKQFEIRSFDYAGEVYRKAFGRDSASLVDLDISGDRRAAALYSAAENADVICLFISLSTDEANTGDKIKEAADAAYGILKNPSLKGKCVVVLTQSHDRKEEIARIGGPGIFLEKNAGASLAQCVEDGIPVITLSSVNETEFSAEDNRRVPGSGFTSDGLLAFLLVVGGRLSPDLSDLGKKYANCLSAGYGYMCAKFGMQGAEQRLAKAVAYRDSVEAFQKACESFLENSDNFHDAEGGFDASLVKSYARAIAEERETKEHVEKSAFAMSLEKAWGKALGDAASRGTIDARACKAAANKVKDTLEEELYRNTTGKLVVTDDDIFGFNATDGKEEETLRLDWIAGEIAEIIAGRKSGSKQRTARTLRMALVSAVCVVIPVAVSLFLAANPQYARFPASFGSLFTSSKAKPDPTPTPARQAPEQAKALSAEELVIARDALAASIVSNDFSPRVFSHRLALFEKNGGATNDIEFLRNSCASAIVAKAEILLETNDLESAAATVAEAGRAKCLPPDVLANFEDRIECNALENLDAAFDTAEKDGNWTNFVAASSAMTALVGSTLSGTNSFVSSATALFDGKLRSTIDGIESIARGLDSKQPKDMFASCREIDSKIQAISANPLLAGDLCEPLASAATFKARLDAVLAGLPSFVVFRPRTTDTVDFTIENDEEAKLPIFFQEGIGDYKGKSAIVLVTPGSGEHRFKIGCNGRKFKTRSDFSAGSWHGIRYVAFKVPETPAKTDQK